MTKPYAVDMSEVGMGAQPVGFALVLAASNGCLHTGEIAALKGLCGLTGYPAMQADGAAVPA